eukprot:GHVU01139103.1.p1 GENE.GHVU01139103.1~~GHVU01139103.1.p1  ORF type:complete len:104 (+),score=7.66 GHVU01139103.1:74-385(+)
MFVCASVCACVPSPVSRQQNRRCRCSNRLLFGCRWIQAKIHNETGKLVLLSDCYHEPIVSKMDIAKLSEAIKQAASDTSKAREAKKATKAAISYDDINRWGGL